MRVHVGADTRDDEVSPTCHPDDADLLALGVTDDASNVTNLVTHMSIGHVNFDVVLIINDPSQ